MKIFFNIYRPLPDIKARLAACLLLGLACLPGAAGAVDYSRSEAHSFSNEHPADTALANADRNARLDRLVDYIRKEGPALVPGLPNIIRNPAGYVFGHLGGIDIDVPGVDGDSTVSSFFAPVISLMSPADEETAESLWLAPDYHHARGILPFDDALVLGFNYRNTAFDDRLRLTVHPYYAQSWRSMDGFWGTEITLGLGPDAGGRSWGKLVMRYDGGSRDLMGHAGGLDLHADYAFDDHLTFSAGARQDEDSDVGNYVLVRWRMPLGN
ncbi:MAG: hypothetical protein AB7H77_12780 [Bdellovibrionales bacterium]